MIVEGSFYVFESLYSRRQANGSTLPFAWRVNIVHTPRQLHAPFYTLETRLDSTLMIRTSVDLEKLVLELPSKCETSRICLAARPTLYTTLEHDWAVSDHVFHYNMLLCFSSCASASSSLRLPKNHSPRTFHPAFFSRRM